MRCLLDRNVLKSKYDRGTCPSISIFFTSCVGTVIRYAHIKVRMFQNAHLNMHDKVLVSGYDRERFVWFDLSMNDKSMKKGTKVSKRWQKYEWQKEQPVWIRPRRGSRLDQDQTSWTQARPAINFYFWSLIIEGGLDCSSHHQIFEGGFRML